MKYLLMAVLSVLFGISLAESGANYRTKWYWLVFVLMWALMVVQYMN